MAALEEMILGRANTLEQSSADLLGEETEGFKGDSEMGRVLHIGPADLRYPQLGLERLGLVDEIRSSLIQTT